MRLLLGHLLAWLPRFHVDVPGTAGGDGMRWANGAGQEWAASACRGGRRRRGCFPGSIRDKSDGTSHSVGLWV